MLSYKEWGLGWGSFWGAYASIALAPFVENTSAAKFESHCKLWQINTLASTTLFWCIRQITKNCASSVPSSKFTVTSGVWLIWVFCVEAQIYKYISSLSSLPPFLPANTLLAHLPFIPLPFLLFFLLLLARQGCRYWGWSSEQIIRFLLAFILGMRETSNVNN